jgi:hypothetical protein
MNASFRVPNVAPGDNILLNWHLLNAEERAAAIQASPNMRLTRNPAGSSYTYDEKARPWLHPWRALLAGPRSIAIRPGRVGGIMATIDGVRLDGRSADSATQDPEPLFVLAAADEPNDELESWGCVQVRMDPKTGRMVDPKKHPDAVSIVHVSELDVRYRDGITPDKNNLGRQPLFCILWKDKTTIDRIEQITVHDLRHEFLQPDAKRRGRHFFPGEGV